MSKTIQFVQHHEDLSTENGYQWEFKCDGCSRTFRSKFDQFNFGAMSSVAGALGDYFGGVVDGIANVGEHIRDSAWEKEHDKAFARAVKTVKKDFIQCPQCKKWVCKSLCWDAREKMCNSCVSGGDESDGVTAEDVEAVVRGEIETGLITCPSCREETEADDKFCPNCGVKLEARKFCSGCGHLLSPDDKFCPECGRQAS